jgi:hypothetical protein
MSAAALVGRDLKPSNVLVNENCDVKVHTREGGGNCVLPSVRTSDPLVVSCCFACDEGSVGAVFCGARHMCRL